MIRTKTCFEVTCDRACDRDWEEGTPHFDTQNEAVAHARRAGFVIVGAIALCQACAADADCRATGHQWEDWQEAMMQGVPYRRRWCVHCGAAGFDRPIAELSVLLQAARVVDGEPS